MKSAVSEFWDEWLSFPLAGEKTDSAELSGLLAALPVRKSGEEAVIRTPRLWAVRRLARLWKNSRWRKELNIAAALRVPPDMKGRVELSLPLDLYEAASTPPRRGNWAWARGAWGGCGAVYAPRSGYYLVMRTGSETAVKHMGGLLRRARVSWSERAVHGRRELALRGQQEIVAFLSKIGLTGFSLHMEDRAILRAMRDQANRMRNCDTANIKKTLKAAEEQAELARELLRRGLVLELPPRFRALAETRLEHPEESLSDLGKRLSPPVTKSTVKYRWKRLCEFLDGPGFGTKNIREGYGSET
ncbi:MAG: DNA-binding protein WhiA [Synergistaceae bacterium]|nr:DNA-binding protein WhiA [Synergistaceae bacterium]